MIGILTLRGFNMEKDSESLANCSTFKVSSYSLISPKFGVILISAYELDDENNPLSWIITKGGITRLSKYGDWTMPSGDIDSFKEETVCETLSLAKERIQKYLL